MGNKSQPSITKCKDGVNWTKVTFKPDLQKFNMNHLEEDVVALMKKRVVDLAGTLGKTVKVDLDGKRVPVETFADYVNLYLLYLLSVSKSRPEPLPRIVEKVNDRWEIGVSLTDGQFQQVSFVNSINTIKGGTHVEYVTNQIASNVMSIVNKKNKNTNLKLRNMKRHLWVFVNCLIDNPAFDSQTKDILTTRPRRFGSKCKISQDFSKKVIKLGIMESFLSWADLKQNKELKKIDGIKRQKITCIKDLYDARFAGGKNSAKCTLILTDGYIAMDVALEGVSVVGQNYYGVFNLRDKLLNVREASHKQIMENADLQNIKKILGLQHGKKYDSVEGLRYGHLMIMTNQNHDGSYFKGLLISFLHSFWPSLLRILLFLADFISPMMQAMNDRTNKAFDSSMYSEGMEYFQDLQNHMKYFVWSDQQDGDAIDLAFNKEKIEARKNWLLQFEPRTHLDQNKKLISYSDFVNKELILFFMADLQYSIPSMVDGLKLGQRKILFCSFTRDLVNEAEIAQYFVGSNNINLLQPNKQFGTQHQEGKDHASDRYIYTKLSPITRFLFPKEDDLILNYLIEYGESIEPTWYFPIIPMVLVNGSEGISTILSSYIPNYNPRDIVKNVRHLLNDEPMVPMNPWYRGFKGLIEKTTVKEVDATFTITGIIEEINSTTIIITVLPIRRWTQEYKEFLESLMTGTVKIREPFIKDYKEYNDDTTVHFKVTLLEQNLTLAKQEGLEKKFKLTTTINTSNMHLFNDNGVIKKYDTPGQILTEFFDLRITFYEKRKKVLLDNLEVELLKLDNKVRFISGVLTGQIKLFSELQERTESIPAIPALPVEIVAIQETTEVVKGGVKPRVMTTCSPWL